MTSQTLLQVEPTATAPSNVQDLLHRAEAHAPDAVAFIDATSGATLSYGALVRTASTLAQGLAAATAQTQDRRPRIGLVLPNGPALSVALLASAIAGEATPFNPALTTAEFERYFTATRIDVLLLSQTDNGPAAAAATALGLPVLRLTGDGMENLALAGVTSEAPLTPPTPDDIALVLMTSGSTGVPKIVPLSHRNVSRSASDVSRSIALGPEDRCLVMWQQFHIGGLVDLLLAPLSAGGALILTEGFSAERFFELRARYAPTWFQGVPTTLGELISYAERHALPAGPGSLRLIRSVAAALTPALQERLQDVFGVPVIRTLGMTEASPLITSTALPPARDKPGSVGRSCGPELRILDAAGEPVAPGVEGAIAIRGDNVFAGYEANPEANAAAFRDGWFLTGDQGHCDAEGDLFLTGRVSEQINRGGYKIMPAEVEDALARHPDVRDAAVFGRSHPTLGEDIAAAVTLRPGATADNAALRAHLADLLAANKIPGRIVIRDALPRNPVGKVDRMALALEVTALEDERALLVAPRNATEARLAEIWRRELEVSEIGMRQDFMMLGGDSLSALRVIVAMEEAFKCPMPDAVVENLTTIETVAGLLDAAQITEPAPSVAPAPAAPKAATKDEGQNEKIAEIAQADVRAALGAVSGKPALDLVLRQLTVYRTPAQIEALFDSVPMRWVGASGASVVDRVRLGHRFFRKRAEIRSEIQTELRNGDDAPLRWEREEVGPAATLYFSRETPVWERTLIAGFSGNGQGMSSEMYRFLLPLDPARFDFLLLRDTARRNLYLHGLPEMGDCVTSLGAWLEDYADAQGYGQRVALGTSGGGLAAIHTGLSYGWDRVVAMCPPRLSKHQGYAPLMEALGASGGQGQPPVVISHGTYANDLDAIRQLSAHLPFVEQDFHPECPKHNLLNFAREAGQLRALYARWFDNAGAMS